LTRHWPASRLTSHPAADHTLKRASDTTPAAAALRRAGSASRQPDRQTFRRPTARRNYTAGYLVDVRGVRVGLESIDLDTVADTGGDFDPDALGDALEEASAPAHVLAAYRQHAEGRKTVIFVPTVALAHRMARVFRDSGIATEALDADTNHDERRGILDRLKTGETPGDRQRRGAQRRLG
jgi:superfamily II DNA or RNA helicase